MYEKHIEALQNIVLASWEEDEKNAIDVAIELMRSAEPKDEAAEREHCDDAADASGIMGAGSRGLVAALVERERAAARREAEAKLTNLRTAAERYYILNKRSDWSEFDSEFSDAIEASK